MKSYRELNVWQKSYSLTLAVHRATHSFPSAEAFGLTSQLRRAAVSVPTNIAEGYCRQSRPDYLRFLSFAQGSAGEMDTLLSLARDLSYLDGATAERLTEQLAEVGRMLTGLARSLRAPRRGIENADPDPRAPAP